MVWLVMCLCMNKVIAWLGCRLFLDMVSQLSLEYNVIYCLIGNDLEILKEFHYSRFVVHPVSTKMY